MKTNPICLVVVCLTILCSCQKVGRTERGLQTGSIAFSNQSTREIKGVTLFFDGRPSGVPCGYLGPKKLAAALMFPAQIPGSFRIEYEDMDETKHTETLDAGMVKTVLSSNPSAKEATIYFVFTSDRKFTLKLYLGSVDGSSRLLGQLFPDEGDPAFTGYKELVRSALDGDAPHLRKLLSNGTPSVWPNEPVTMTPLEWTVRWEKQEAFDVLMERLPKDFDPYAYYNCIRLATQSGSDDMLKRLLQANLAKAIPDGPLQEIFYEACYVGKKTRTLEILLEHFKVGVEYKTRDYGHTLLFVAVQAGNLDIVRWLLAHGADPNAKLQDRTTPLKYSQNAAISKLLVEHGGK